MKKSNAEKKLIEGAGVRKGVDYLNGLKDDREIWLHGQSLCTSFQPIVLCDILHSLAM